MRGIKILLEALGIRIDPAEVEQFYQRMQVELPGSLDAIKTTFKSIDSHIGSVDTSLDQMTKLLVNFNDRLTAIEDYLAHDGAPAAEQHNNGKPETGRTGRN